ncbi:MAG: type II toxin-antitoxin system RelE/ParE family toxin [Bacteroidetes bacterium]|nr:type II toxin-antitoxin system RelE/ParE family toxin [Bacteroidota bacterium]
MNWQIDFSKVSVKFLEYNKITDDIIISHLLRVIKKFRGENISIDLKKMKGEWKGFYRLRIGKIRIIFKIEFQNQQIYIDRIDFRGDIYK